MYTENCSTTHYIQKVGLINGDKSKELKQSLVDCFSTKYIYFTNTDQAIVDIRLRPRCAILPRHFAANDRLVQRLQSSVCHCRVPLHGSVQLAIISGIRLIGHVFPLNCPSPSGIATST